MPVYLDDLRRDFEMQLYDVKKRHARAVMELHRDLEDACRDRTVEWHRSPPDYPLSFHITWRDIALAVWSGLWH